MFGRLIWVFAVAALALPLGLAKQAVAQTEIAAYFAHIGPEDMRNSRGVRLTSTGAILQQDRANFHRFGIRHPADETDPYFSNRDLRARIPDLYARGPRDSYTDSMASWDFSFDLVIFLCGRGSVVDYLVVNPADGDGYSGC